MDIVDIIFGEECLRSNYLSESWVKTAGTFIHPVFFSLHLNAMQHYRSGNGFLRYEHQSGDGMSSAEFNDVNHGEESGYLYGIE